MEENLTKLERRERSIHTISSQLSVSTTSAQVVPSRRVKGLAKKAERLLNNDPAPDDISLQYSIGKSENSPIDLGVFLARNAGDPAIAVRAHHRILSIIPPLMNSAQSFYSRLRLHLLPRIQEIHHVEAASEGSATVCSVSSDTAGRRPNEELSHHVLLKNDRIYHHKQVRGRKLGPSKSISDNYDVRSGSTTRPTMFAGGKTSSILRRRVVTSCC